MIKMLIGIHVMAKDIFENEGHVRHFFSTEYARELLGDNYEILKENAGTQQVYEYKSYVVQIIAKKK
jgi:hypothetical protein